MFEKVTFAVLLLGVQFIAGYLFPREEYEREFFDAMMKFGWKIRDGNDYLDRIEIFASNYDYIMESNKGNVSVTLGVGQYAHMELEEFHEYTRIGSTQPPVDLDETANIYPEPPAGTVLESSIDWVANGAVGPVQDQGGCGSCWAFSATGAIEGAHQIKYGRLPTLSEQQLVSCDKGDDGCNGGWMGNAFSFVKSNRGLTTDGQYPYTSGSTGQNGQCKTSVSNIVTTAPLFSTYVTKSVSALQSALTKQPISIAVDASSRTFQHYAGGVITSGCGTTLNHGVLLVGYGVLNGVPYWKVKNSWGASWGANGYVLIERSNSNICGVLSAAIYPTL